MKNLGQMMKQAQEMQARMAEFQAALDRVEIAGKSGGGLVEVVLSGKGDMRRLRVDPTLLRPEDSEMLEDLVLAAHNEARAKIEQYVADEMKKVTGGLSLPGNFKLPF
ncbi:MAG: YbaB/EbfC family nucleoid-associated protein [Alphaproteobacteria bacterium]|nr:YbaB/EbfC family nucleoid-associated protein [Alphaproteobacteria bacterium]